MAGIEEIAHRHTLSSWNTQGSMQEFASAHACTNGGKLYAIAWGDRPRQRPERIRLQYGPLGGHSGSGSASAGAKECAATPTNVFHVSGLLVDSFSLQSECVWHRTFGRLSRGRSRIVHLKTYDLKG